MRRSFAALLVLAGTLLPPATSAQEQIYVTQPNPGQIHAFTFDGTAFARVDLDGASSSLALRTGLNSNFVGTSGRFYVVSNSLQNLAVGVVDSATGTRFPRVRTTVPAAGVRSLFVTPDARHALLPGRNLDGSIGLSIVDLDPASATFLKELSSPIIAAAPTRLSSQGVLHGQWLFYGLVRNGPPQTARIVAVDVSAPAAPVVGPETTLTLPVDGPTGNGQANRLFPFQSFGEDFLLVARSGRVQIYRINMSTGALTFHQDLPGQPSGPPAQFRAFSEAVFVNDRAIALADRFLGTPPTAPGVNPVSEELLVYNLSRTGAGTLFTGGAPLSVLPLGTTPTAGNDSMVLSGDGSRLYVLDTGDTSVAANVLAFDIASLLAGTSGPPVSIPVDPTPGVVGSAAYITVASPPSVTGTPPAIGPVTVNGSADGILLNDTPGTIEIDGTGLDTVTNAFVGQTRATIGPQTPTHLALGTPKLIPAETTTIKLVTGDGGLGLAPVTIHNAASYQPAHVAFGSASASNEISVINAASATAVTTFFASGPSPNDLLSSPDGRLGLTADLNLDTLSVFSLVADPGRGWAQYQRVAAIPVGPSPQRVAIHPTRKRAYTASLTNQTLSVIDLDPGSPTFLQELDTDGNSGTTSVGAPAGVTRVSLVAPSDPPPTLGLNPLGAVRSLAMTPDGKYLYAGRLGNPQLVVIDVQDDTITASDITFVSIAAPAGSPSSTSRADGLAVSPDGSRLYFTHQADTGVRVFDITAPTSPLQLTVVPITPPAADVRRIQVRPDGRYVYVSSRSRGAVDVIDTTTNTVVSTIPVGLFSSDPAVSQDGEFVYVAVGERDVMATLDAREVVNASPNPAFHSVVAATATRTGLTSAGVWPGLGTPAGSGVSVSPATGVDITFSAITAEGNTTVTSSNVSDVPVPAGFAIDGLPVFYEIRTTASFTPPVTVCLPYDDAGMTLAQEGGLRLLHAEAGAFVDRTTSVDTAANKVCGDVSSFSLFVILEDRRPPTINMLGADPLNVECHGSFSDPGATATDALGASVSVSASSSVDANTPGSYTITYTATDARGHVGSASRAVIVSDSQPPTLTLNGSNPMTVEIGDTFVDPGATAQDACAGAVSVQVSGSVNTNAVGTYVLTYSANDGSGHTARATRTVNVVEGERRLCSVLGNECRPRGKDIDVFDFEGSAGESVTLTLTEDPSLENAGERVKLTLRDDIRHVRLMEVEKGPFPEVIHATLPASGRYTVKITRLTGRHGFRGHYCIALRSSGNAFRTFEPARSVE